MDAAPLPAPLTARTWKAYAVPFLKPVTVWRTVRRWLPGMGIHTLVTGEDCVYSHRYSPRKPTAELATAASLGAQFPDQKAEQRLALDADTNTAGYQVSLVKGEKTITISVTAPNGADTYTYTVVVAVTRADP